MKYRFGRFGAVAFAVLLLIIGHTVSYAGHGRILLTPHQTRIYHNCLTEDWIADYCRGHSWGIFSTYDRTYAECVAAEHYGRFVVNGRPPSVNMEAYCWHKAHGFLR